MNLLSQQSTEVVRGNLLTLPVGGGLLYVQPVYVQAQSGTTYPLLRFVLTSFGDKIGFAPTLQASLDQLFGGDAGVQTSENEVPGAGAEGNGENPAEPSLTPEQQLQAALQGARKAMDDADAAMKAGDWEAYGKAQTELKQQLQQALTFGGGLPEAPDATQPANPGDTPGAQPNVQPTTEPSGAATPAASPKAKASAAASARPQPRKSAS